MHNDFPMHAGTVPMWLNGKLIRTGPGLFEIGDTKYNHWFDGLALLHSFNIQSGILTYCMHEYACTFHDDLVY